MTRTIGLALTEAHILLLAEALDSHVYWQLSSRDYRHEATVVEPGSNDPEAGEEIGAVMQLHRQLQTALGRPLDEPIGPWVGLARVEPGD